MSDTESELYARLGASSSKAGLHAVLDKLDSKESSRKLFAQILENQAEDPGYFSLLHADSTGTKAIVAYLAFRETGDASWFKTLAQDSLVMNLDDIACVGALDGLVLNNTISRNRRLIPDQALEVIISEYKRLCALLAQHEISITMCGGETEDLGDVVRTLCVGSTLFARSSIDNLIDTARIETGDVIIGFANFGQATYESAPNSGIASNGLTLARAALIPSHYKAKYPEICDLQGADAITQSAPELFANNPELGMPPIQALLSPTRTYAPLVKKLLQFQAANAPGFIHGLVHCTGGGQSKILRFGNNKLYLKDNLFPIPPIFKLIQRSLNVPWKEMYSVFNMGHRLELACSKQYADQVIELAKKFNIEAQIIGRVEDNSAAQTSELKLSTCMGEFSYKL